MSEDEVREKLKKLGFSKSTLDLLFKIKPEAPSPCDPGEFQIRVLIGLRTPSDIEAARLTPFPEPALPVGGSPMWNANDVDDWLTKNRPFLP